MDANSGDVHTLRRGPVTAVTMDQSGVHERELVEGQPLSIGTNEVCVVSSTDAMEVVRQGVEKLHEKIIVAEDVVGSIEAALEERQSGLPSQEDVQPQIVIGVMSRTPWWRRA